MEKEQIKKIVFSNNGKGVLTPKITILMEWLKAMGVTPETEDTKKIKLEFDEEKGIIKIEKYKK